MSRTETLFDKGLADRAHNSYSESLHVHACALAGEPEQVHNFIRLIIVIYKGDLKTGIWRGMAFSLMFETVLKILEI